MVDASGDKVAMFHAGKSEGGPVHVYDAAAQQIIATIPMDLPGGWPAHWNMASRIAALLVGQAGLRFKVQGYRVNRLLGGVDWRWRAVSTVNGNKLASGQGYSRKVDMLATVGVLFPGAFYEDVAK